MEGTPLNTLINAIEQKKNQQKAIMTEFESAIETTANQLSELQEDAQNVRVNLNNLTSTAIQDITKTSTDIMNVYDAIIRDWNREAELGNITYAQLDAKLKQLKEHLERVASEQTKVLYDDINRQLTINDVPPPQAFGQLVDAIRQTGSLISGQMFAGVKDLTSGFLMAGWILGSAMYLFDIAGGPSPDNASEATISTNSSRFSLQQTFLALEEAIAYISNIRSNIRSNKKMRTDSGSSDSSPVSPGDALAIAGILSGANSDTSTIDSGETAITSAITSAPALENITSNPSSIDVTKLIENGKLIGEAVVQEINAIRAPEDGYDADGSQGPQLSQLSNSSFGDDSQPGGGGRTKHRMRSRRTKKRYNKGKKANKKHHKKTHRRRKRRSLKKHRK